MFETLDGFLKLWEYEAASTQKVMDQLTDESLGQEITPENWTLGRIAWHTVCAIRIITSNTGLTFQAPDKDNAVPTSAKVIADQYREVSSAFAEAVETQWTDKELNVINDFYGEQQPNALFLQIVIHHQIHHRGQMTVLLRQAGLTVPGVYGPAKEEWAEIGMESPK
ncbi:putative damage-inducible protein DinB [Scopulibacillus darangshiensis]|uniref:Putative damage-inducible protein DinB n=1 Tax=Scopulibacillus darangshiensis TaxID=442528 RepID=A0A4R2P7X0_9BACL|nr:DinB family protein [Scopulibacillus darangshiensis]TCP29925.1 putative damage-inducible protein DinB [Scopulibacillus darangshiensis]